jgi:urease accessory protein
MGTATITMTTTTDAALLQLIWLASPALPVGGFSYSEGLEAAVDRGLVRDEATAATWLADQLHLCLSRADLAVMADAMAAWRDNDPARVERLNAWVLSTRETAELRQQTEQMGRSLVEWLRTVRPEVAAKSVRAEPALRQAQDDRHHASPSTASTGSGQASSGRTDLTYPIAFALAASGGDAPVRESLLSFAFGWAENMVQAAIKSVPLGQGAGQRILRRLAAELPAAVDNALSLRDDGRQAFSPMLAILSAQHETQYSRLFRS